MAIPNKQIGWSQEANLIWEISRQLERLIQVAAAVVPSTPGIDDVLAQAQSLTANRSVEIGNNVFEFNPSQGNGVYLKLDPSTGVASIEASDMTVKSTGQTLTLALNGAGGYINIDGPTTSTTTSGAGNFLEIYVNGQQYYLQLYNP